ncbi:MAG: hypothetical protein QOH71_2019 [Blastocatellia bacterium]|jgi:hypothetical protein|nr:hypothetical protein [Blastocatellia bacterium]
MNGNDCRTTRREIDESELNQKLSEQAGSHVASCAACRDFRAERSSLRELVGSLEPVVAPGDFELRLRARLANENRSHASRPFFFRLVTGTPAIVAAALVVAVALSLAWFTQRNPTQSSEIAKVPIRETPAQTQPSALAASTGSNENAERPDLAGAGDKISSRRGSLSREKGSRTASVTARDYGTSPAESYQQIEQRAGEVSLSAPLKPMVVSMQDDRGETRRISLPPVSFGAERLVNNRIPVSATNSRSW